MQSLAYTFSAWLALSKPRPSSNMTLDSLPEELAGDKSVHQRIRRRVIPIFSTNSINCGYIPLLFSMSYIRTILCATHIKDSVALLWSGTRAIRADLKMD